MSPNVGGIDKVIRVLVGLGLLSLLFLLQGNLRWLGLIGIVPILTALCSCCPLYTLIGINTCPTRKA